MSKPFNIHDWQAKQRQLSEDKKEAESMSNADIGAINKMVKKYSMDKIMKTINILKDRPLPEGKNSTLNLSKSDMEKLHKD